MTTFTLSGQDFNTIQRDSAAFRAGLRDLNRQAQLDSTIGNAPVIQALNPDITGVATPAIRTIPQVAAPQVAAPHPSTRVAAIPDEQLAQAAPPIGANNPDTFAGKGLTLVPTPNISSGDNRGLGLPPDIIPQGFDPITGTNNIGTKGAPGFFQPSEQNNSVVGGAVRRGINEATLFTAVKAIGTKLSVIGAPDSPATGFIPAFVGQFTDNASQRMAREVAGQATDWYDSPEAMAFFRQNPQFLGEASNDPIGFFNRLQANARPVPAPAPAPAPAAPAAPAPAAPVAGVATSRVIVNNRGKTVRGKAAAGVTTTATPTHVQKILSTPTRKAPPAPPLRMAPALLSTEITTAQAARQEAAFQMRNAAAIGDGAAYNDARQKLNTLTLTLNNFIVQRGIDSLENNHDPRLLSRILTDQQKQQIDIGFNSDGSISVNGAGQLPFRQFISSLRKSNSLETAKQLRLAAVALTLSDRKQGIKAQFEIKKLVLEGSIKKAVAKINKSGMFNGQTETFQTDQNGRVFAIVSVKSQLDGSTQLQRVEVGAIDAPAVQ